MIIDNEVKTNTFVIIKPQELGKSYVKREAKLGEKCGINI